MAAIIYLDIVKTPELNGEVCVHSFVVNPSAKSDRQKDTYFMATPIGYTRLKLAELCPHHLKTSVCRPGSQIVVFSSDNAIARTGASFGVEDGDTEPVITKTFGRDSNMPVAQRSTRSCSIIVAFCPKPYMITRIFILKRILRKEGRQIVRSIE